MASVCLREMTAVEHAAVQKLAHSRTAPAHRVQRAQIIWRARCGESASAIAAQVGLDGETVRKRIRRFNAEGLEALKDRAPFGPPADVFARAKRHRDRECAEQAADTRVALCRLDARPIGGLPARAQRDCDAAQPDRRDPAPRRPALAQARDLGSVSGSIRRSPKKGADRDALHRTACGQLCESVWMKWDR